MITVVIVDDRSIVKAGLRTILDSSSDIHVVAEALRLTAAVQ